MNRFTKLTVLIVTFQFANVSTHQLGQEDAILSDIVRVGTVEDHPWIIKNETCLKETPQGVDTNHTNACYKGLLKYVIDKIQEQFKFNYTIVSYDEFGKLDESQSPPKWTGLIGALANKDVHVGLAALNITEETKSVVDFSSPLKSKSQEYEYALAFPKNSTLTPAFSHVIMKLVNQRYIEQLVEMWFHESKDLWKKEKQLTSI